MASSTGYRYSQNSKNIGEAKNFSWEYPVPANDFWNPLDFVVGRNFLQCFSADEIARLPLDSTLSKDGKLELLLQLLQEKLFSRDAAAAPQTLYDVDYAAWDKLLLGMCTMQGQLGQSAEAEKTIRSLVDRRKDRTNLSHLHSLSGLLAEQGKHAEAEETEMPVKLWLDERLGKDSPQALGSRRIIAKAMWKQGPSRQGEARELLAEVMELIGGMSGGQFAVYQAEQRETTEKMIADLERGRT
ncbi:hypothetical protein W97_03039 [Coniosporium apollinis CBS 100218]|uniref:Uncharacterized protein n=1 Tax=Coniosporium apollinis (strain CBS 100218) TaxID=1168221 RepID=R7YQ70_CONA1|nr:uncharacterized protein W97_03039 [Coniosporium apollinis CBS 100218]EON63811.1 hypothetical protein W97_03039 [Coniosporium apollinis CBS 100218]